MSLSKDEISKLVTEQTASILSQQKDAKEWGIAEHLALLCKIAIELGLPEEGKADFKAALQERGLGGNSSQFRQSLVKAKLLPESKKDRILKEYN